MVIKSLEYPVNYRRKTAGLAGTGSAKTLVKNSVKSFEEYLMEAFQGELVQNGNLFSAHLSAQTKTNLSKIRSA